MRIFKEIEVADLSAMLKTDTHHVQLVDIRNPSELVKGVIPGAENIPMNQLPFRLEKFNTDQLLVLYCQVGARSAQACSFLSANGYDNVHSLRGGILAWSKSGLQVA